MAAQIIDGKRVAAEMRAELKEKVAELKTRGVTPGLAVVLVGEDPASKSYVTAKERACEEIGIYSDDNRLAADTQEEDLLALIDKLNKDSKINGILVQLPLPKHIDEDKILLAIDPAKDGTKSCWPLIRRKMWMVFTRLMSAKWSSDRMPICPVRRTA